MRISGHLKFSGKPTKHISTFIFIIISILTLSWHPYKEEKTFFFGYPHYMDTHEIRKLDWSLISKKSQCPNEIEPDSVFRPPYSYVLKINHFSNKNKECLNLISNAINEASLDLYKEIRSNPEYSQRYRNEQEEKINALLYRDRVKEGARVRLLEI